MSALPERGTAWEVPVTYPDPDFPLRLSLVGKEEAEAAVAELHRHRALQFALVLAGAVNVLVEGAMVRVATGEGLFINSQRPHRLLPFSDPGTRLMVLQMEPEVVAGTPLVRKTYLEPLLANSYFPFALLKEHLSLTKTLAAIHALWEEGVSDFPLRLETQAAALFEELVAMQFTASPKGHGRRLTKVERMLEYVSLHYPEPIALPDIAEAGNVSKNACIRLFRQVIGATPVSYLTTYRLQQAADLLLKTDQPVTEIAYAVGFTGSSYFTERFRRFYGMTPREFRVARK